MENNRIQRLNELIKKEVGNILLREVGIKDTLITITEVEVSEGLSDAKIYVSVLPEDSSQEVFAILESEIYGIQQKLNKRLRMRPVPKIIFAREKRIKEAEKIEKILEKLKK